MRNYDIIKSYGETYRISPKTKEITDRETGKVVKFSNSRADKLQEREIWYNLALYRLCTTPGKRLVGDEAQDAYNARITELMMPIVEDFEKLVATSTTKKGVNISEEQIKALEDKHSSEFKYTNEIVKCLTTNPFVLKGIIDHTLETDLDLNQFDFGFGLVSDYQPVDVEIKR